MLSKQKNKTIVGLDLDAGSVAATEVRFNGGIEVTGYGVAAIEPGMFQEGEVVDPEALGGAIKELFSQHKLGRLVRLGIANQRVAVRTMQLPRIENRDELETAIRFQAQDQIPMPLDQAVLDWQVVPQTIPSPDQQTTEVVVVAARRDMLQKSMAALRAAGLRPVGIDHSAFGMIRALAGELQVPAPVVEGQPLPARLFCNLGDVTNLAVARGGTCLFTRISSFGLEGVAQRLAERKNLTLEHARQWLVHVGLDVPVERVDGDRAAIDAAREVLVEGTSKLADELRMSLEFYAAQEGALRVEDVVACGPGTAVPGLVERLQSDLGLPFQTVRPHALANLDQPEAARLSLSYGLALEG
jgi:type IV pilus assembly protein PilM